MTFKRIIAAIILIPLAIIVVAFMVANRAAATLALNPFDSTTWHFTLPFFIWLFLFLIIGMIIGGFAVWFEQHKYRKALHECQNELAAQKAKNRNQDLDIAVKS
ncbi:LapA family protein [Bartonella sp. HY038]|uniref:LapA family protein n=1 Tax=Bartonella sp. HY038 TaxID=2759660 RepID=UPI0015F97BAC|nr:LapA family protein [Bartonella sp. HY038]